MRVMIVSIFMGLGLLSHSVMGIEVREFFEGTKDDVLKTWDPCQADFERLIKVKRNNLVNIIDAAREGPENCKPKEDAPQHLMQDEPKETDRLGPSLITPVTALPLKQEESCGMEVLTIEGKKIAQRNELRFLLEDRFRHNFTDPHWYALRFKMKKDIPSCGSVRWVIAQWKYKDKKWPKSLDPSPFLAQRFDNGVLHLTVQNEHCRCMVAKAPGDPDREDKKVPLSIDKAIPKDTDLKNVEVLECKISKKGKDEGKSCRPEEEDLQLLAKRADILPELPDPKKDWVRMAYWIEGAKGSNRTIDVWANGRFVARIKGMVGYPGGDPRNVKFKFGAYRDKFKYGPPRSAPPRNAHMLVDEICVTKSKDKAVSGCR